MLLGEAITAFESAQGEARPRPCRVQQVIVYFRLDLWLIWFNNYKEMSGLDRQELVEKPAKWGGNRSTQITSVFMFSFDGKESFLSLFQQLSILSPHIQSAKAKSFAGCLWAGMPCPPCGYKQ